MCVFTDKRPIEFSKHTFKNIRKSRLSKMRFWNSKCILGGWRAELPLPKSPIFCIKPCSKFANLLILDLISDSDPIFQNSGSRIQSFSRSDCRSFKKKLKDKKVKNNIFQIYISFGAWIKTKILINICILTVQN